MRKVREKKNKEIDNESMKRKTMNIKKKKEQEEENQE